MMVSKKYFECPQCGWPVTVVIHRDVDDGTYSGYASCNGMCRCVAVANQPTERAAYQAMAEMHDNCCRRLSIV